LRGRISISDENYNSYGTLGGLVWDRISGVEIIPSNWRVLVADWNARDHGFVEMSSREGGAAAIAQFNGGEINGRRLTVNQEEPQMTRAAGASFGGNWSWKRTATL
jgi:hypothetical protein